jgi:hypothetical protein
MQTPTHLVTGVLIQKAIRKVQPIYLRYFLVVFLTVMSHGIMDRLARFTYHPPMPLIGDWFWVSYHIVIAFLTIYIFVKYWRKYKIGLISSIFPDFDWVILHSSSFFSFQVPFWKEPVLHKFFSFLDFLPPLSFLHTLPDWNLEREGAVLEFAVLATLVTFIYSIKEKKAEISVLTRQQEKIISNWIDKLSVYVACMDHHQSIRTAYQSLLTTLEVGILSLFFFLYELKFTSYLWIFFIIGMLLCLPFTIACEFQARIVDIWRVRIVELVKATDVEDAFREAMYRWIPFGKKGFLGEYLFGHWFERIFIFFILLIWWYIGLQFFLRPFTIAFIILVTLFWGAYVFRLVEPKGEVIPYLYHRKK